MTLTQRKEKFYQALCEEIKDPAEQECLKRLLTSCYDFMDMRKLKEDKIAYCEGIMQVLIDHWIFPFMADAGRLLMRRLGG